MCQTSTHIIKIKLFQTILLACITAVHNAVCRVNTDLMMTIETSIDYLLLISGTLITTQFTILYVDPPIA